MFQLYLSSRKVFPVQIVRCYTSYDLEMFSNEVSTSKFKAIAHVLPICAIL
jgi:hypothetical protein